MELVLKMIDKIKTMHLSLKLQIKRWKMPSQSLNNKIKIIHSKTMEILTQLSRSSNNKMLKMNKRVAIIATTKLLKKIPQLQSPK